MKDQTAPYGDEPFELHLLLLEPVRPWWSLLASMAGHGALVASVALAARFMLPEDPELLLRQFRVEPVPMMEVRLPPQLYFRTPAPEQKDPATASKTPVLPPRLTIASASSPKPGSNPAPPARRRFELPREAPRVASEQTILQIDPPEIQAVTQTRLPELVVWNQPQVKIKAPPKKFIAPGRNTPAPANPALLDAAPVLAAPNMETRVADLKLAASAAVRPNISTLPATTMPLSSLDIPVISQGGADVTAIPGLPANLITTNPNPAPLSSEISVPAVTQLGAMPENTGSRTGSGTGSGAAGLGKDNSGSGSAAGVKVGGGSQGTSDRGKPGVTIAGMGNPGGSRVGARVGDGTGGILAGSVPIRIFHPDNGVFDVVVTRTSTEDLLPGVTGLLTGQTVYMVYLKVGTPKEWILQYSDAKGSTKQSGSVITLGNPAPVKAPYPRKTLVPPAVSMKNRGRAVFRGLIDVTGQFKDLKLVGQEETELAAVLVPFLKQWEFRPATRDSKPVEVEILLAVPPSAN